MSPTTPVILSAAKDLMPDQHTSPPARGDEVLRSAQDDRWNDYDRWGGIWLMFGESVTDWAGGIEWTHTNQRPDGSPECYGRGWLGQKDIASTTVDAGLWFTAEAS